MLEPFGTASLPERIWDEENIMPLGANKAAIMGVAGVSTGDVVLLSSQTADGDSTITFSSDITSTYGEYIFRFYSLDASANNSYFQMGVNATDGADYNDSPITSTYFRAEHAESDADSALTYMTAYDRAEASLVQSLTFGLGDGADESCSGELHLFNPASTTYVKHFYSESADNGFNRAMHSFRAGYFNTTSAIDAIAFKTDAGGAFDATIKMWGVK